MAWVLRKNGSGDKPIYFTGKIDLIGKFHKTVWQAQCTSNFNEAFEFAFVDDAFTAQAQLMAYGNTDYYEWTVFEISEEALLKRVG